jgi:hypothetical protein
MGLPGGRGSPIGRRAMPLGQAWPVRTRRLARLAAITANPPDTARAAASTASDATSQPGCPLGSGDCVRGGHLGGRPVGDGEALAGQLPLEGGVRGSLLR